ncbi:MAG: hypothetical protein ACOVQ7_15515 [Limnoraphis robusta]|jgi:hypothetical protein
MVEAITQQFRDEIAPVRIDATNGDGRIITIVDWASEAASRVPVNAVNIQWSFTLEYLSFHYYFPTLNRIPTNQLPEFKLSESDTSKQAKSIEFKRKFTPDNGYAVQFLLWRWFNNAWRPVHSARDWLSYLGLEGHIGLIHPYFLDEPGVMFGGVRHKIGISIAPRNLEEGDYIEINGGYSGEVSYVLEEDEIELIEGTSQSIEVGTNVVIGPGASGKRAALYITNGGTTRLYFKFSNDYQSLLLPNAPFLEPGESLSYEHGKFHYSGGNSHLISPISHRSIAKMSMLMARQSGRGLVSWQELRFP